MISAMLGRGVCLSGSVGCHADLLFFMSKSGGVKYDIVLLMEAFLMLNFPSARVTTFRFLSQTSALEHENCP
jgi:hypothetical protein